MIESLPKDELSTRWYTHLYTMPMRVSVRPSLKFAGMAHCPDLDLGIEYGDLYETEREALEVAHNLRATKVAAITAEIETINQRRKEILP